MACCHLPSVRCTECSVGQVTIYPTGIPTNPQYTYAPPAIPHKCPVCEGKGSVPEGFYDDEPAYPLYGKKCRSCWGQGVIWRYTGVAPFTYTVAS